MNTKAKLPTTLQTKLVKLASRRCCRDTFDDDGRCININVYDEGVRDGKTLLARDLCTALGLAFTINDKTLTKSKLKKRVKELEAELERERRRASEQSEKSKAEAEKSKPYQWNGEYPLLPGHYAYKGSFPKHD